MTSSNYWKRMYGTQSDDFIEGVKAGLKAFAWWKDGVEFLGQQQANGQGAHVLKEAIRVAEEGLGGGVK